MNLRDSPVSLTNVKEADWDVWLECMEASFAMGIQDARLQPGEEPIPAQEEMRDILGQDGVDVLEIVRDGRAVGGAAVAVAEQGRRSLELFFIDAGEHGRGIGARAWKAIEEKYPIPRSGRPRHLTLNSEIFIIYINTCGFHAVEFFHPGHQPKEDHPNHLPEGAESEYPVPDCSFRFEKRMTHHVSHWS